MADTVAIFGEIFRLYIFMLLILAAYGKSKNVEHFRESLVNSFFIPQRVSQSMALIIIGVEWFLAFGIIVGGRITYFATMGSSLLFCVFTVIIAFALSQNRMINCNCFGSDDKMLSIYDLIRNICVLGASLFLLNIKLLSGLHLNTVIFAIPFSAIFFLISMNLDVVSALMKRHAGVVTSDE